MGINICLNRLILIILLNVIHVLFMLCSSRCNTIYTESTETVQINSHNSEIKLLQK